MTSAKLAHLEARLAEHRRVLSNHAPIGRQYERINRKLQSRPEEKEPWQDRCREVRLALQAERAHRRTHHEAVLAAQPLTEPDVVRLLGLLTIPLGGGLTFGGILALLPFGLNRSVAMTVLYVALLAALIGLIVVVGIPHSVELPVPKLSWFQGV